MSKISATVFFLPYPIILFINLTIYCVQCFFLLMLKERKGPINAFYYSFSGLFAYYVHRVKEEYARTESYFTNEDF